MDKKIVVAVIVFLGIVALSSVMGGNGTDTELSAELRAIEEANKLSEQWTYKEQVDEMRGKTTHLASIRADGLASFAPELIVFWNDVGRTGLNIRGSLDSTAAPQVQCMRGFINMKFDDGPLRKVNCQMGIEVRIDPAVIPDIKKSKVTWIEIETSIGMVRQYKFKTAGLKV